jgi:hypothetical protein
MEEFIAAKTNTAEAADSKLRKCKWLFVNGSDCKSPSCAATEFVNSCRYKARSDVSGL